jgi:HAD superfamily hydrolase (TIGR01509 family)
MPIRNVVFDVGEVLLRWNPRATVAALHPDPTTQSMICRHMFEHDDWHEFDRGGLSFEAAVAHFAGTTGLSHEQTRALIHATRESLTPIPGTLELLDQLASAGVKLYLLSNMPESTYEFLSRRFDFFGRFHDLVISGKILLAKPDPAIFRHLFAKTGITPAESVFLDDLPRNVAAARDCGMHAIQFRDPASCRAELRTYLPDAGL